MVSADGPRMKRSPKREAREAAGKRAALNVQRRVVRGASNYRMITLPPVAGLSTMSASTACRWRM